MLNVPKNILLFTYTLAKCTSDSSDNSEYKWYREPLYEYLMEQSDDTVEFIRTLMYIGREVFTGADLSGTKEEVYDTYNSCAKDPKDISAMEICSKTPLHDYLKCGFRYFDLGVLAND